LARDNRGFLAKYIPIHVHFVYEFCIYRTLKFGSASAVEEVYELALVALNAAPARRQLWAELLARVAERTDSSSANQLSALIELANRCVWMAACACSYWLFLCSGV
jgi:hypothetical protein